MAGGTASASGTASGMIRYSKASRSEGERVEHRSGDIVGSQTDVQRDLAVCGCSLVPGEKNSHAAEGAHDPAPTPYFVLEDLLGGLGLTEADHMLDVGCGTGRVLAYAVWAGLPGQVTGVELDARLAARAASWSAHYDNIHVVCGSVLDLPLEPYSCFYLFNPFDTPVLRAFLDKLEREAARPVTLVHMSDNGEWPAYLGRSGWTLLREGAFDLPAEGERDECPQHFSVRRFTP